MKPKILLMSDHSGLHTGFANVSRHIGRHLYHTGKYEIRELGWYGLPPGALADEDIPLWKVYTTDKSNFEMMERDKYAQLSLAKVIADYEPNIVLTIGDEWMTKHTGDCRDNWNFKWISYCPIDGTPHPPSWSESFSKADVMVAYGKWGKQAMKQRKADIDPLWIWHGVDREVFKPFSEEKRRECKEKYFGDPRKFIVGCVARNQPRKQIPILMKAFAFMVHSKRVCLDTGLTYIDKYDHLYINQFIYLAQEAPYLSHTRRDNRISPFTGSLNTKKIAGQKKPNQIGLYLHMPMNDLGWDLIEQASRYKILEYLIKNDSIIVGKGVPEAVLADLYNSFDVFALPTIGEGWGLPISEAMSCGIPTVVTNYSAHTEWAHYGGPLINVQAFYTEPKNGIERAIASHLHLSQLLDKFYDNEDGIRDKWKESSQEITEKMDWKLICKQWEDLVDETLITIPDEPYAISPGDKK